MAERDDAIKLANQMLDRVNADPDDNLAMLSRSFLREIERADRHTLVTNYQALASVTESKDFDAIRSRLFPVAVLRLLHAGIGFVTEAGEFLDALKKHIFYGKDLDWVNISEEQGDLMWYLALASNADGVPMVTKMERNIKKLRARYGEKFDAYLAQNRNLLLEREVLEGKDSD